MEKTAIEWLVEQLNPSITLQQKYIDELKEKAKQKEKQQIIDAATWGANAENGEQYYKETFK
jgi:hypothetical protein